MNKFMVGFLLALLIQGIEPVEGQVGARVEYRNGNIGVAVAIGDMPIRITHGRGQVVGRVAIDLRPRRVLVTHARVQGQRGMLTEGHLRQLLGKRDVRNVKRHARAMGLRGSLRGQWYRIDRQTMLMEITMGDALVAEVYDYGRDGYLDQLFLVDPHGGYGVYRDQRGYDDDRWDDDR